jgi:predicted ATPase/DNA-binding SARP family transcriptional activator/Tfp pilus assembly protein PilF
MGGAVRVFLAGRVGIAVNGAESRDTSGLGRLGRVAFAYLVTERHRPITRDELAEVLWGEDLPRTWDTSVRVVMHKLRTWLAGAGLDRDGAVTSGFGTYQLHLPADAVVDVEQAAADVEAARAALAAGDAAAAVARARAAAGVAAADFLPGGGGQWVEQRQDDLRELRVQALELTAQAALAMRDVATALAAAEAAVAAAPLRESAHLLVVRAHAASANRGEALRAYDRLRRVLAEELGVSPSGEAEAAYLDLLGAEDAVGLLAAPPVPAGTLPVPASTFLGREGQVDEVAGLVRTSRIVTLTGTGGLGKTRLALEVARRMGPDFAGGAVLVPLAEVHDRAGVGNLAVAAFGLAEQPGVAALDTLVRGLRAQEVLLVLDNCEHVVEAAAELVAAVVPACPGVAVLATSREALRVPGEVVWGVPVLDPAAARRLFLDRATAVAPGFELDPADEEAIETLCRRLDGLPLALELAAARVDVLSVQEIVDRLDDRFRLLAQGARTAPARQQTLRGAIDWTYDGLVGAEQRVLQQVSVFAGAWTLTAAAAICGEDVADSVHRLVARSLVAVERGRPTRHRLLETIRDYATEKLDESGDGPATRTRLLEWAVALAEEAEGHLDGPEQARWLDRLDAEAANLRGALAAAAVGAGNALGLRLATALGRFWEVRGHFAEGREWLRAALASADGAPPLVQARAHNAAAILAQRQGDYAAARSRLEASLALRRQAGDRMGTAIALHGLGNVAALQHQPDEARGLYEDSLAVGRELGNVPLVASALDNLGWVAHATSDFEAARAYYAEALAARRRFGDEHGVALTLAHMGDLAYQRGDYAEARAAHEESLGLRERLGDRAGRADSLATLGHLALGDGDVEGARALLEASLAVRRELGDRAGLPPALVSLSDAHLAGDDLVAARRLLEEAARVAGGDRDGRTLAHVHVHLARVAREEGDVAAASSYSLQAHRRSAGLRSPADVVTAEWLEGVGATVAAAGDGRRGARLLGAADALRTALGVPVPPHERPAHDRDVAALRKALGPSRFGAAWKAGRALPLDAALDEAVAAVSAASGGS